MPYTLGRRCSHVLLGISLFRNDMEPKKCCTCITLLVEKRQVLDTTFSSIFDTSFSLMTSSVSNLMSLVTLPLPSRPPRVCLPRDPTIVFEVNPGLFVPFTTTKISFSYGTFLPCIWEPGYNFWGPGILTFF